MNIFEGLSMKNLLEYLIASRGTIIRNLDKALKDGVITPRERAVFYMRNIDWKSLEQVGKEFGVTRERIRQIENKVIDKLS